MKLELADWLEFELESYKNRVSLEFAYDTFDYYAGTNTEYRYIDLDKKQIQELITYLQECVNKLGD